MAHLAPTRAQIEALVAGDADTPVVMLNLLRFAEPDGRASYQRYGERVRPLLEGVGGRVIWQGRADSVVIGDEADTWDTVILVEYPSRAAFLHMTTSPDYAAVASDRTDALADSRLIAMTEASRAE